MLDSFGIGEAKDAKDFGDEGSSTLKSIMRSDKFNIPNMKKLGLLNIDGLGIKGSKLLQDTGKYPVSYQKTLCLPILTVFRRKS